MSASNRAEPVIPFAVRAAIRSVHIVALNNSLGDVLPLEGQLVFGKFCQSGGLLEEEPIDPVQNLAHELIEFRIGELAGQETDVSCRVVSLDLSDLCSCVATAT